MRFNSLIAIGFAAVAAAVSSVGATVLTPAAPTATSANPSLLAGGSVISPGFTINLSYTGTPTAAQQAAFTAAKATWESYILGYKINDIANNFVDISVSFPAIDGVGGTLGSAGPTTVKLNAAQNAVASTYLYTQNGVMNFDSADADDLISSGEFNAVVLHEMGHVLGIGTLWSSAGVGFAGRQELYVNGSGQYTGAFGLAAYNAEFGQSGTSVPVELGGGSGTANGHWDEVNGGSGNTGRVSLLSGQDMRFELMTGWLNSPTFTSQLTIQGMQDLGYLTAIPEPTSLAAIGLFAVTLLRRRARC